MRGIPSYNSISEIISSKKPARTKLIWAEAIVQKTLQESPTNAVAWRFLALLSNKLGSPREIAVKKALCLCPFDWRGKALMAGHASGSDRLKHIKHALSVHPTSPQLLNLLIKIEIESDPGPLRLKDKNRWLCALSPGHIGGIERHCNWLGKVGDFRNAWLWLSRLETLGQDYPVDWMRVSSCIPPVHVDNKQRDEAAQYLKKALKYLRKNTQSAKKNQDMVGRCRLFYLAYAGFDDTALQCTFGDITGSLTEMPTPSLFNKGGSSNEQVAIVTGLPSTHSVWRAIGSWWLSSLVKAGISVRIYDLNSNLGAPLLGSNVTVEKAPRSLAQWRDEIVSAGHRLILFPEIGMEPKTLFLANHRLAPHQAVSWGHPVTSGLPYIDSFISGAIFEPSGTEKFYRERLIRLPSIGVGVNVEPRKNLKSVHVRRPRAVLCQTVFKYLPQFDEILIQIAKNNSKIQFIIFRAGRDYLFEKYFQRVQNIFYSHGLDPNWYLKVQNFLPRAEFEEFLEEADVYLDSPSFSGFNTAMSAIRSGLPIVTSDGHWLRNRLAAGLLLSLDPKVNLAKNADEYLLIACNHLENREKSKKDFYEISLRLPLLNQDKQIYDRFIEYIGNIIK